MHCTAAEIAEWVGGTVVGESELRVDGVGALDDSRPTHVSFLGDARYADQVLPSPAAVVLVPEDFETPPPPGRSWVRCADPSQAFSRLTEMFAPPPIDFPPGVHPAAVVSPEATVSDTVHIGPQAVVERGAVLGERCVVGAGAYIGHGTRLGQDCHIHPNVTIRERCILGNRVIIHSGTVIGADGFGYIPAPDGHRKIPQTGIVQIDDDVEIGALVGIDRARFGRTWIKQGAKIDNLVQIGHNTIVGRGCFVVSQVGISGSCRIGDGAMLAGQVGLGGHLTVGKGAVLMAQAGVAGDVPAGAQLVGSPAVTRREFVRRQTAGKNLEALRKRVKELERTVAALAEKLGES